MELATGVSYLDPTGSLLYPNPVTVSTEVHVTIPIKAYRVIDASGRLVKAEQAKDQKIFVADLPPGTHAVIIQDAHGREHHHRLVKLP